MSRFIASKDNPATLQHIFDAAWGEFVVKDRPPSSFRGYCQYLGDTGRRCAVGLVLSDQDAVDALDYPFGAVVQDMPHLWHPSVHRRSVSTLSRFQRRLHDDLIEDDKWKVDVATRAKMYRAAAKIHHLSQPPKAPCEAA